MAENNFEVLRVKLVMELSNLFQTVVFIVSKGLVASIYLTIGSFFIGLGLGSIIAFLQIIVGGITFKILNIIVRILRSIPPILVLFLIFYGLKINSYEAAIIGLGLISASYQSQILRGVVESVIARQFEAALSIGFSRWEAYIYIVVPQALLASIPALLNEFATLLKDTSIAYAVGAKEMFTLAINIANARMEYAVPLISVSIIYLAICLFISSVSNYLVDKLKYIGLGVSW
jgi:polar amino acid transport system permease protein